MLFRQVECPAMCGRAAATEGPRCKVHGAIYLLLQPSFPGTLRQSAAALRYALSVAVALLVPAVVAYGLTHAYHGLFGADASHSYCATLRTCVLALAAYRLLTDDIHQDRKVAAMISLLVYGRR